MGVRFNLIGIEILISGVSMLLKFYLALFSGLAIFNLILVFKKVIPTYTKAFLF